LYDGAGHDRALQESSRGYTHILVAIDKFTKWIEYKPIAFLNSA
jgi:transposase InsO family protein